MASNPSSRRQPTRSARASAARPTNYYAKPFSYRTSAASLADNEPPLTTAPGFFPAITHFTDSLGALPREVQRHFTTLKETEGKAWQPDQAIAELVTAIRKLPPPPHPQHQDRPLPYMQLSTTNSVVGSVSGSVVDGITSRVPPAQTSSDVDMTDGTQALPIDEHASLRQDLFVRLQQQVSEITKVLDEKAMVLTAANETLGHQLHRLNGSFPHIENEVSEEARLGSNTHWALPHMKELRRTNGSGNERRRDVTNVNNLAAAAAAVHETEIAATRSEARREAMIAKRSRVPASDFGFDDRAGARKSSSSGKVRKTGDATQPSVNGSSSNKRRRVEKPASSTGGERSMSAALHGRLAQPNRNGSRESGTNDVSRKKNKPLPVQAPSRKKNQPNSPSVASSPTRGTFATSTVRTSSPARAQNSRVRRPSDASVIHDAARKHSTSASRKQDDQDTAQPLNGPLDDRSATMLGAEARAAPVDEAKRPPSNAQKQDLDSTIKGEAPTATPTIDQATAPPTSSHSRTNSRSAGTGVPAKPPTPHNIFADVAPLMSRSRSGRGTNPTTTAAGSPTGARSGAASPVKRSHKRGGGSNANARDAAAAIAAAAAPGIATSPASSDDERPEQQRARRARNGKTNGAPAGGPLAAPAAPAAGAAAADASGTAVLTSTSLAPSASLGPAATVGDRAGAATDDDDEAEAEGGSSAERDEAEPLYCFCQQPSEGEMIACDNEACPTEWFHLECVQLARAPKNSWFCSEGCKRQALRGKR